MVDHPATRVLPTTNEIRQHRKRESVCVRTDPTVPSPYV
jgi:hypothetical protein